MKYFNCLMMIFCFSLPIIAQQATPELIIEKSIDTYKKEGVSGFLRTMFSGGPLDGTIATSQQGQFADQFAKIEEMYSKPIGFDIIREIEVTPKFKIIYFTINYEYGLTFAKLQAYRLQSGQWVTIFLNYNSSLSALPFAEQALLK